MSLAGALHKHKGTLRASLLAEYGLNLERGMSVIDLADYTAALPHGCALWRAIGGPMSLTPEAQLLNHIEWRLQILAWIQTEDGSKGRNQPKAPQSPPYTDEKQAEDAHAQRQSAARARREARTT